MARRRFAPWVVLTFALAGVTACAPATSGVAPTDSNPPGSGSFKLGPIPADPVAALHDRELELRRDSRQRAELANLGPGAPELADFMDRTGSFLLTQAATSGDRPERGVSPIRSVVRAVTDAPAGPVLGLPEPGVAIKTPWAEGISNFQRAMANPLPDAWTKSSADEVSAAGSPGTITTSVTITTVVSGSTVSVEVKISTNGEVRDPATGATVFRIASEGTAKIQANACPDATGLVKAHMEFSGRESYFASAGGAGGGAGLDKVYTGDARITADDEANLADFKGETSAHEDSKGGVRQPGAGESTLHAYGLDATGSFDQVTGQWAVGSRTGTTRAEGERLGRDMNYFVGDATLVTAKAVEKAWRSGRCIAVLVDPEGGDVEKDSVTTVTAKVKHKFEGGELTKPVEAALRGVKSIDPAGKRRPAPATFTYTAGPADGDKGDITFKSVSNRGIGETKVTFTVGGGWTISSVGTYTELEEAGIPIRSSLEVSLKDLKVTAGKDNALSGSGMMTLRGPISSSVGFLSCTGQVDHTFGVTVTGSLVGTAPNAVLKVTIHAAPSSPGAMVTLTCTPSGSIPVPYIGDGERYALALGELDLPAAGGTTSFRRADATANITVVRGGH